MSEKNETPDPAQETGHQEPAEAPKPAPPAEPTPPAQETDWKAEAKKWESRAKENKTAAERLAALEEEQKTAEQKQVEALEAANAELARYRHREQVAKWAADTVQKDEFEGVPASALRGDTLEDIEAHAAELKSLITPQKQDAKPVNSIGNTPRSSGNIPISEQIAAAEASGNKQLVAALKAMQLSN